MEKIVLVINFSGDFDGKGNNRFLYLAEMLSNSGYEVELITSDFSHEKKCKRDKRLSKDLNYKVTYIEEPKYKKNVSLKRFYSHFIMSKNLKIYLDEQETPKIIYCGVPSLSVSSVASRYSLKNDVKFIIDIQDLWPEAFEMVFPIPVLKDILFYPLKRKADKIYKSANSIIAVSSTYLSRALKVNKKTNSTEVVYLGTDLIEFDKKKTGGSPIKKKDGEIWLVYAGTLGHSYDLSNVFQALLILKKQGINNLKFIVMGTGPLEEEFKKDVKEKKIDVLFTGRLPYAEMVKIMVDCDIAINPIKKGSAASIVNKHADYAAAGLPVINTQESIEYRELIERYEMGVNCVNNDASDLSDKILSLIKNPKLIKKYKKNSRRFAEEKFDRRKTYLKIISTIESMLLD